VTDREATLRSGILAMTRELTTLKLAERSFVPGESAVPYAGRVHDEEEVAAGVASMLDFWLTLGPEGEAFERELGRFLGVRRSVLVNSGSSANLLAFSALTSWRLGDRRILQRQEIITAAAGFPTTVAPMIQAGAVPVFVDSDPLTGNICSELLEEAYAPGRTRAVMVAHTLGNPFNLTEVRAFCKKHDLWLIEDNCDALGSKYGGAYTGTFGDVSTQSFYAAHHMTLGEGGAVNIIRDAALIREVESFRDWGRDCWCGSGEDNTCGKRFEWQLGELPSGYDHKYVFSHLGYNLKPIDPQAAIGRVQLHKLPSFIAARIANWNYLRTGLADLEEFFAFMLPTHATGWSGGEFKWTRDLPKVEPSWFAFMLLVRPEAPFSRLDLARALEKAHIGNRMLFGGNLVKQPAFLALQRNGAEQSFRVSGRLDGADRIMRDAIFVGVYPGLKREHLDYIVETIHAFCRNPCKS
jgi:CDP-6-deoxy-D-xylo-4-hexulose-3-dehydrase